MRHSLWMYCKVAAKAHHATADVLCGNDLQSFAATILVKNKLLIVKFALENFSWH